MNASLQPIPRVLLALALLGGGAAHAAGALSLTEALVRAAQANPAILQQQAEVEKQTLEQVIARGQHLPQVDLDADWTRHAYPSLVTPIRASGVFPPLDRDVANVGLALSLPLYSGGRLVAGEALATHNREAALQSLRASEQDLLFNVVATYTKALHFRELGTVLDARIKALLQQEKDIVLRLEQGRAARLDLIRLQTRLSQARYDKVSVTQGAADARALLAALLGEAGPVAPLADLDATAPALPETADAALARALVRRPELRRFDAMGLAAEQRAAIARGERLPQVNLAAKVQESSGSDWTAHDDWNLGLRLTLPVFDGGIRKRRVEQATLEQRQMRLQRDDVHNRIASEVEQAFGALTEARARLDFATQGETEAREALHIETLRYQSGESTITDLLGAEAALWSATANRLQAGYDITASQARLLRAMGELAPDSFKSAGADATQAVVPRLERYLAWHRCGFDCSGPGAKTPASVAASFHPRRIAADHPGRRLQPGARL
jgi:outer membrane protein TolC